MENKIIYANQIQLAVQVYDFTLTLNTNLSNGETVNQTTVYLSPQHTKALLNVLEENVNRYEELFGVINIHPDESKLENLDDKGDNNVAFGDNE